MLAITVFTFASGADIGRTVKQWKTKENAAISFAGDADPARGEIVSISADCTKTDYSWARCDIEGIDSGTANALRFYARASAPLPLGVTLIIRDGKNEIKYRAETTLTEAWKECEVPFAACKKDGMPPSAADLKRVSGIMFSFAKKGDKFMVLFDDLTLVASDGKPGDTASVPASSHALPAHPRLLFNAQGIVSLKDKITRPQWTDAWKEYRASVDQMLAEPFGLPPRGGNWSHNYVCPEHGARLKRGKKTGDWEWEHSCPAGNHILTGNPAKANLDFDGNVIAEIHSKNAGQALRMGVIFQLTGDAACAARAKEILIAYAKQYRRYELHSNNGKKGSGARVHSQSLTEASWLIDILQGADLVWQTLTETERGAVENDLIRAALNDVILKSKLGIHNIQCRLNSAIGLSGFLLGDGALIARAIDDPEIGYRAQMAKGVQSDGVWREGAWGYHFFTIEGLWPLVEAAKNCGIDLYGKDFNSMFDAPIILASPTFWLPAFNDSGEVRVSANAGIYEIGYARYKNPQYASIIAESTRKGPLALYFGTDDLSKEKIPAPGSRTAKESGYAILEKGAGSNATWFCLKYGPHGGGHGHPDKLNFVLYARGMLAAMDPGTRAYGSPIHDGWDKTTFAHNTLTVDQASQAESTGSLLAFGKDGDIDYAVADAGPIYKGVRFVRAAALVSEQCILIVDLVDAAEPHTLDIVYHQRGIWKNKPDGTSWTVPGDKGYRYLKDAVSSTVSDAFSGTITVADNLTTALSVHAGEPTEIITATGVGNSTEDRIPLMIMRRKAGRTAFVWAVTLDGVPATVSSEPIPGVFGAKVSVTHGGKTAAIVVNPDGVAVQGSTNRCFAVH